MGATLANQLAALCPGRTPLSVQVQVSERLMSRGRAIVMLPTGAGKTLLAALPFAAGLLQPRQMVFMTPLRTLADAQTYALREQIDQVAATTSLGLPWEVRTQTGIAPEDPLFTAPAVVCTFDQALSSALSIAFSTSVRRRGINAAAILDAYLVADEIHLYPRDEALTTLLWLLKHRPDLPFLLMTATLSRGVAEELAGMLDADVIETLPPEDAVRLGTSDRHRVVHWQRQPFDAPTIVERAHTSPDGRVIVVVNTVARARELGHDLMQMLGPEHVLVLHSRFYPSDRERIERELRTCMGKISTCSDGPAILIATQVIEVGLDISAGLLLSEWAPANALVQRWGRCARWGGTGEIVVAPPPKLGAGGLPAPYDRDSAARPALAPTREWLCEHAATAMFMTVEVERALLDHAHNDTDRDWIDHLGAHLAQQATPIGEAIQDGHYSHAGGLIRRVDQRTVLVHGEPEAIANPWQTAGFSLATGTLHGLLQSQARAPLPTGDDDGDLDFVDLPEPPWRLKVPIWDETGSEGSASRPTSWADATREDLQRGNLFALNPALASYDPRLGLGLLGDGPVPPQWWASPVAPRPRPQFGLYRRESLAEHVGRMAQVFERHPALWRTVAAIEGVVEEWCGWPRGLLRRMVLAAILLHDAGKLTDRWQRAISDYQIAGGNPYLPWLVHSDQRPGVILNAGPHALTGAALSTALGKGFDREVVTWRARTGSPRWDDEVLPSRVLFTAIATHHGAQPAAGTIALTAQELISEDAQAFLTDLLRAYELPATVPAMRVGMPLHSYLVVSEAIDHVGQDAEYLALTLVSRLLRLADGWSQDESTWTIVEAGNTST